MSRTHAVSVVIPTYRRLISLDRLLGSLQRQQHPAEEIILAIAEPAEVYASILSAYCKLNIRIVYAERSVCAQRNAAIREAKGVYVFLCDDDMELPSDYIQKCIHYIIRSRIPLAVSGLVMQREAEAWQAWYPFRFRQLVYAFVFCQSIWFKVSECHAPAACGPLLNYLKRYYRKRGNTHSKAGWPLLTQAESSEIRTEFYGIGASIIPRQWLLDSPYDERLHPNGYGDNYGVALHFPGTQPIVILADNPVFHHRDAQNRIASSKAWYHRSLALARFMADSPKFGKLNKLAFAWSLLGSLIRNPRLAPSVIRIYMQLIKFHFLESSLR